MNLLLIILTTIGALLVGIYIGRRSMRCDGLFLVDDSDDQKTKWILDVKIDPETIPTKKSIHLKVMKMDEGSCE